MNKEEPENSIDADAVNWLQNGGGCEETRETQFSEHDPHPRCALGGAEELPAFERFGIVLANNIFRELKGFELSEEVAHEIRAGQPLLELLDSEGGHVNNGR